ncbi:MAG TPA: hypothetical protein VMB21_21605 [Candidatus Limnocylindria bacterium]|jgi:hypothetical protein|nr:hypothetical protein [Candidatus Limnocylindria bacterium]
MRLKPTTTWLALAALLVVVAVLLARRRGESGPIVAGKPLGHWVDIIEDKKAGKTERQEALGAISDTTNKAALQSLILDRIEAAYSPSARSYHQAYISTPAWLRRLLPKPRFGHIQFQTVVLLDGIMPEPSARQRAAIRTMLYFTHVNDADFAVQLAALSTATQTIPESIAFLRERLATDDATERLNICETIRAKYKFDGWSRHRDEVAGLLADLRKLAASDPDPGGRKAARQALDKLTFELGASESAGARSPGPNSENTLIQPSLFASPVQPADRPLALDAPRAASELNLELAPPTPTTGAEPFKP